MQIPVVTEFLSISMCASNRPPPASAAVSWTPATLFAKCCLYEIYLSSY